MLQCCKHRAAYLHSGEMTLVWLNLVSEYVLLMAQLLTKGDRMPPLVIIVPAHESCAAPPPITLPPPGVTVTRVRAGAWLLLVYPAES